MEVFLVIFFLIVVLPAVIGIALVHERSISRSTPLGAEVERGWSDGPQGVPGCRRRQGDLARQPTASASHDARSSRGYGSYSETGAAAAGGAPGAGCL